LAKIIYDISLGRCLFRNADYIISNSKPTLSEIERRFKIQEDKMAYVPNAVDFSSFRQSRLDNKRVLFVGRLIENKGIRYFPRIIEALPRDWTFTIIGDGPMEDEVKALASKHKNIQYLGKLSYNEIKKYYEKADVVVLPTFAEGSPRVILEACASGVPSVVFDVGDVPTILDNNRNGFCIERYNINKFIKKIKELVSKESLRREMGGRAREYAKKNLDWKVVYKKMIEEVRKGMKRRKEK
jgi:glycosyltransferase involved in cell wall biosynthesis